MLSVMESCRFSVKISSPKPSLRNEVGGRSGVLIRLLILRLLPRQRGQFTPLDSPPHALHNRSPWGLGSNSLTLSIPLPSCPTSHIEAVLQVLVCTASRMLAEPDVASTPPFKMGPEIAECIRRKTQQGRGEYLQCGTWP